MKTDKILLDHGNGGKISHHLISDMLLPIFDNPILSQLNDSAILNIQGKSLAFSTDTFTVDPVFFPGGNIGDIAVNGTVNNLAMCGASPLYLSVGLVIEEGFSMADLEKILKTMKTAAGNASMQIVTGDTKVVPKGAADNIFINTSGIGLIPAVADIAVHKACVGDKIIVSGDIGDHGIAVLSQREGMSFESSVISDTAPLNYVVKKMLMRTKEIHVLRDPTRGGVGTALNEIADKSDVGIQIYEDKIPVKDEVARICELLGVDPLYVANEGKFLAFVREDHAEMILEAIRRDKVAKGACIIGEVVSDHPGKVVMETRIGGTRIVDMLTTDQLPRIC
ncbi:hydrogenase expression/formation protein HypE [Desulfonema magnum]|uniref:Carbamoyl dehydratase n=1 Tax=Desulfonema magnum TaxID=45655 RepID=A0A975BL17_9BACT|nr:hydrogenase expression/formation protein HypE [Desulfonema magnum]QTA87664.1 Carbamoyl dehydratase [Desulfonema magnum]